MNSVIENHQEKKPPSVYVITCILVGMTAISLIVLGYWWQGHHNVKSVVSSAANTETAENAGYTITRTVPGMGEYTITEVTPEEIVEISVTKLRRTGNDPRPLLFRGFKEVREQYVIKDWLPGGFDLRIYDNSIRLSSVLLLVEPRVKRI